MQKCRFNIDFTSKKHSKMFLIISASIILITIVVACFGLDMSIDFKGGTIITYSYEGDVDLDVVKSAVQSVQNVGVTVQNGDDLQNGTKNISVSFTSNEGLTAENQAKITTAIQEKYPDNKLEVLDSTDVSPSAGKSFFIKCIVAVAFAAIVLVIYIAIRFKKISGWSAGVCAIIALCHDVFFVFAAFVFFGFEINANFMAATLTILGYSLNDTVVIYDRIRENMQLDKNKTPLRELVNDSLNQTLTRSIRTSVTTISAMVVVSIVAVIYGIDSIMSFSIPLIIGMTAGAYSSITIAPNIWIWWTERKGKSQPSEKPKKTIKEKSAEV